MTSRTARTASAACLLLLMATLLLFARPAAAALVYSETVDGDLPESAPWKQLALDAGVNTVSGSGSFTVASNVITARDFDSFRFVVPAGNTLTGLSLWVGNVATNVGTIRMDTFLDTYGPITLLSNELMVFQPTASALGSTLATALPLTAGEYLIFQGQLQLESSPLNATGRWDYTWSLTVGPDAQVPEPSTLALVGSAIALAALGMRRRRSVAALV